MTLKLSVSLACCCISLSELWELVMDKFLEFKQVQFPFAEAGLPWWLRGKESACSAGDTGDVGLIPGSGKSPGEGNGKPLEYSCLENSRDRGL